MIMKTFIITIHFLFICSIVTAQTVDSASLMCLYKAEYINDIQNPQNVKSEEMMLLVGNKLSNFYSYTNFLADSLRKANPEDYKPRITTNGNHTQVMSPPKRLPKTQYFDKLYIERSSGNLCCLTSIITLNYQYNEQLIKPEWQVENETIDILGYRCQKATASYKGRNWTVWFTLEIPVSEGPWKLRGLPGLILKAEDSEKHYSFECTAIERLNPMRAITKNDDVAYQAVAKKDYDKLYETYFNDPSTYLENVLGGKISITSPNNGSRQYNPIER